MKQPKIQNISAKKMVGMQMETSLSNDKTRILWSQFMPRLREIRDRANKNLYSIQEFEKGLKMEMFTPHTKFKKWAAVEITDFSDTPKGMENFMLRGGLFAVFQHKGLASAFHKTAQYIFSQWIPNSKYDLDNRYHFEILGENYLRPDDPNSKEEVWVPIKN